MGYTGHSDLYGAVHEDGFNHVVRHVMKQRPSLFNYATSYVAARPGLWCMPVDVTPTVIARRDPLFTIEEPLPVFGTGGAVALNYCFQLTKLEIDLNPLNIVKLPPELAHSLPKQPFVIHGIVCAGLDCPSRKMLESIPPPPQPASDREKEEKIPSPPQFVPPSEKLQCFCLELFVVGHLEVTGHAGDQYLVGKVDGLEIVDIEPIELEGTIECYLKVLLQLVILPRLKIAIEKIVPGIPYLGTLSITLSPISPAIPANPAIDDDQIKAFIDLGVTP